jgi:SAM-dependent methyltransferase
MRVLDAGCGRRTNSDVPQNAWVVGIDVDEAGLALNTRLNERIVGDIQQHVPGRYDTIYCNDVLEHLPDPMLALENLAGALEPGGTLHIRLVDVTSRKAVLTKFTPHRFHVWVYRYVFKYELAGRPGRGPFPTYLRWSLRHGVLLPALSELGLRVVSVERVTGATFRNRRFLRLLAGGATELSIAAQKPLARNELPDAD